MSLTIVKMLWEFCSLIALWSSATSVFNFYDYTIFLLLVTTFLFRFNELYGRFSIHKRNISRSTTLNNFFYHTFMLRFFFHFMRSIALFYLRLNSSLFAGTQRNATNDETIFHVVVWRHVSVLINWRGIFHFSRRIHLECWTIAK